MIKFGKIIVGLVLLVSLALTLSYCGSKSSDSGGSNSTGNASAGAGASASNSAIRSATMSLSATAGSSSAPSLGKAKNLSEAVNGFYNGLRAKRAEASALKAKYAAAIEPYRATTITPCLSGTITDNVTISGTTYTSTTTYANCTTIYSMTGMGNVSEVLNGASTIVLNGADFTFTGSMGNITTPYTDKITRLSDNAVLYDEVTAMTFAGSVDLNSAINCGTPQSTEYERWTFDSMNGSSQTKGIDNSLVAYDETYKYTAYAFSLSTTLDPSTCNVTAGTVAESGQFSYTNNLSSLGTESYDISAANPLTLAWTVGSTGDTYTISGTVGMATSCFTGSLTLSTTTPLFYPTNGDCPTQGEVAVSGDVNGSVVYTSTGGVDIKDGTGAVVETYPSCNEAQACR